MPGCNLLLERVLSIAFDYAYKRGVGYKNVNHSQLAHKFVSFRASGQQLWINGVRLDFVAEDSFGKAEFFGGFSLLAAGFFQRIDN